jgi:hypothetical protein
MLLPCQVTDLMPCDFFLWGNEKDAMFAPSLPTDIPELQCRITDAVASVTRDIQAKVWEEMEYCINISAV